jgi:hypothetical protein
MKHLKKFNSINENHTHENEVDLIIDAMQDFLDDDRKILFKSPIDDMNYQDYIDKNSRYKDFKPIIKSGNSIRGYFVIVFHDVRDYTDFISIVNQMQTAIGRLKDEDWTMFDMKIGTSPPPLYNGEVKYTLLSYYFSKPEEKLEEDFKWPDEEDFEALFSKYGLVNLTFDYHRYGKYWGTNGAHRYGKEATEVTIEFDSTSYNGAITDKAEELFELACNRFGFTSYNYSSGAYRVTFEV